MNLLILLDYSKSAVVLDEGVGYNEISSEMIMSASVENSGRINRCIYLVKIKPTSSTVTFNMHSDSGYNGGKYAKNFTAIVYK